ncbi:MAG: AEC family transporter [Synergistaceae bacterium]|nr:AEC family transporter [Synergistaceae bacterium]MDY0283780.1 AEC family transporter [Synergistaceae bacterium]
MFGLFLVLPLMLIIITGNLLRSRGFYSERDIKTLTKTLYWVILPPLLIRTTFISGREVFVQIDLLIGLTFAYILTISIAAAGAVFLYHRDNRERIAVSVFSSIRANNIYLGFPVIMLAMGETGLKDASIYIAVSTISFQIISIMAGEFALSGKFSLSGLGGILKRLTVNPLIISCALGIGLALAGLRTIPGVFDETMKLMGGAATAIALLALGGTLDLSRISSIYNMIKATWHDCLIKLVIHPIILWVLLLALSVPEPLLKVTVMLSSMPSAVNCFIMAKEMKMDSDYAADLVASTTVLGIISIPVWANILGII